jgi:methionine-rich copper-binding protein CopC
VIALFRLLAIGWGLILLVSGGCDLVAPRARLVDATPPPGAELATPPAAVTLRFGEAVSGDSHLAVRPIFTLSPTGERAYVSVPEFTVRGPDPSDPTHRTMRVEIDTTLENGLYSVQWRTVAARGRATRSGSSQFGVGMPVPEENLRDGPGGLRERDFRQRQRAATIAGGLILIVLGLIIGRRP